jgi:hypothetical protein
MNDVAALWTLHRDASWPKALGRHEGELMTIDTVISGCATFFLDTPEGLDPKRVEMLRGCLSELENLLPELADDVEGYFVGLRHLGEVILLAQRAKGGKEGSCST